MHSKIHYYTIPEKVIGIVCFPAARRIYQESPASRASAICLAPDNPCGAAMVIYSAAFEVSQIQRCNSAVLVGHFCLNPPRDAQPRRFWKMHPI